MRLCAFAATRGGACLLLGLPPESLNRLAEGLSPKYRALTLSLSLGHADSAVRFQGVSSFVDILFLL